MKIAVCDDDLIFQRKIKEELDQYYQSLDVLVEIFSSGEDLLRAAAADPYGFFCVFLDIEMPGIDGMETARRLGELNRNLPVLFLTSHRDLAVEGYELTPSAFSQNPWNMNASAGLWRLWKQKAGNRRGFLLPKTDGIFFFL